MTLSPGHLRRQPQLQRGNHDPLLCLSSLHANRGAVEIFRSYSIITATTFFSCSNFFLPQQLSHKMAPEPAPGLMKVSLHNPIESKAKRKSSQSATNDPVGHESLRFEYERNNSTLDISFRRTVRVPDNDRSYDLPPDGGAFPLYSVNRHRRQLPADIVDKGGVFLPIYRKCNSFELCVGVGIPRHKQGAIILHDFIGYRLMEPV